LDKERYLIKLGSKARQDLKEPFLNLAKEFNKVKNTHIDSNGNIGEMEFDEGDVFGKCYIRFYNTQNTFIIYCNQVREYSDGIVV
jgi:hypothetical protein